MGIHYYNYDLIGELKSYCFIARCSLGFRVRVTFVINYY